MLKALIGLAVLLTLPSISLCEQLRGVFVAVQESPGQVPLPQAGEDMYQLARTILECSAYPVASVSLLRSDSNDPTCIPSNANILATLKNESELAQPSDILLFAWYSHGTMTDGKQHFHAQDTEILPLSSVLDVIATSKARAKVVVITACRDPHNGLTRSVDSPPPAALDQIPRDTVVLSSGDAGQLSFGGIFTNQLSQGLRGEADRDSDGFVTISEAYSYASSRVPGEVKRRVQRENNVQTPTIRGELRLELMNTIVTRVPRKDESIKPPQFGVSRLELNERDNEIMNRLFEVQRTK